MYTTNKYEVLTTLYLHIYRLSQRQQKTSHLEILAGRSRFWLIQRSLSGPQKCNAATIQLQYHKHFVALQQSAQAQYNCNTNFLGLQLLQVACKFSASCIENSYYSVVLQGSAQMQYNCNTRKKFLYCSCVAVLRWGQGAQDPQILPSPPNFWTQ